MGINNVSGPKFADGAGITNISDAQKNQAKVLKDNLEDALVELTGTTEYFAHLSTAEQVKIKAMVSRIKGEIALLDAVIAGDIVSLEELMGGGEGSFFQDLPDLASGWHGQGIEKEDHDSDMFDQYDDAVSMNTDGELVDVIKIPAMDGDASMDTLLGNAIGFVIHDEDNVESIVNKTVGKDVWCIVEKKDGSTDVYVLKGLAHRTDVMYYNSAMNCENDIIMNNTLLVRQSVDDNSTFSTHTPGIVAIGGKGNDVILGSNQDDLLIGGEGNDILKGLGGWDNLYGDTTWKSSPEDFLQSINDETGGDDYLDGGEGYDKIYGGGGGDDIAVRDPNGALGQDKILEVEEDVYFKDLVDMDDLDDLKSDITALGWSKSIDETTGEVVLTKDPDNDSNTIKIQLPDGYKLSYGDDAGTDLVITIAKESTDEDTPTKYLRVRIENPTNAKIEVEAADSASGGTIMDFSSMKSGGNEIKLIGSDGVDFMLGPITNLAELHIKAEDLKDGSSYSKSEMEAFIEGFKDKDSNGNPTGISKWGGDYWADAYANNNEIVLEPKGELGNLAFQKPEGFGSVDGVFMKVEGQDLVIQAIHITDKKTGAFDMIQIRIKGGAAGTTPVISFGQEPAQWIGSTAFESGEGSDFVVGDIGSTSDWGDDDSQDGDTMLQGWQEVDLDSGDPSYDPKVDTDEDGVYDFIEEQLGTDPNDPNSLPEEFKPVENPPAADGETGDPPAT